MMIPIKCDGVRISSNYGNRTYYYKGKKVKDFHCGIDLVPKKCTGKETILAFEKGEVTQVHTTGEQYGKACFVRIKHENGLYTLYYHLKSKSICVKVGQKVKKGDKIGVIGTTGQSTGIHLHFQIDKGANNTSINPYDYLFNGKQLIESTYKKGNYKTLYNMYVRAGAGTTYKIKKVKDLTPDGKKHATSKKPNDDAIYKKGTIFTASEIINQNGIWGKSPSGYICIKDTNSKIYCKKC